MVHVSEQIFVTLTENNLVNKLIVFPIELGLNAFSLVV